MARSLDKVHKKVAKKKGSKINSLHVNSRDAQRLRAASAREEKLSRLMDAASRANQVYGKVILLYRYILYPDNYSRESGMVQSRPGGFCWCFDGRGGAVAYSKVCSYETRVKTD